MSKKHKKGCKVLNYIDQYSLIVISTITGCVSISDFALLVGNPIGITSPTIGLEICVIIAGMKKYNSIIRKIKTNKIILLAKSKLNSIEVLTSKVLIDSNINHDEFALVNNVLKEFYMKKSKILTINKGSDYI